MSRASILVLGLALRTPSPHRGGPCPRTPLSLGAGGCLCDGHPTTAPVPARGRPLVVCVCLAGLCSLCGVCLPCPVRGDPVSCVAVPCLCWPGRLYSWGCSLTPLGIPCVRRESSRCLVRGLQHPTLLLPGLCTRAGPPDRAALVSSWCLFPSRDPAKRAVQAPWFSAPLSHVHTTLGSVNVQRVMPKRQCPSFPLKILDC